MTYFNKKGDEGFDSKTAMLIFGVAALIILIGVIYVASDRGGPVFSDWLCRASVYLSDQTLGFTEKTGLGNIFLCKTKEILIEDNREEKVLQEVADRMRTCWWMWGEGNWDPSPNVFKWDQNKCFTCHRLETTSGTPDITIEELTNYLQDNEISRTNTDYWNYLRGDNGNAIIFDFPSAEDKNEALFRDGKFYDVTYINTVETSFLGAVAKGAVTGATIGAVGCAITGAGAIICGTAGAFIGGTVIGMSELVKDYFQKDVDGIMLSEAGVTKNICDAVIE
ncbi:glycine zipper family protein [Candidatus Woesearchaeota archaeon]|nr:glycine zipper family protein [Candidatus Woesearchaeota archaeon]